jgi:hypothetical protein
VQPLVGPIFLLGILESRKCTLTVAIQQTDVLEEEKPRVICIDELDKTSASIQGNTSVSKGRNIRRSNPIYFDWGLKPHSRFLYNIAENIGIPVNEFDKYANIEDRKSILRGESSIDICRQSRNSIV